MIRCMNETGGHGPPGRPESGVPDLKESLREQYGAGDGCFNCGGPYRDTTGETFGCEWCPIVPSGAR